jgi:hypothetical protein
VLGGVVIDATLEYFRVEILFPVLPYIWLSIACFLTVDVVRRSRTVESYALKLYGSLDARRRMISYIVVAIVGAGVFDLYWLGISRVFQARGPMKASFSEKAKESNTVLSARTQNPSASKQQGTQDADGSGQYTTPSAATTSHVANPIGNLARLGWGVKDTATFEINAKPLPDLQESALYFRALRKPFQLHFQQVSSIAGLHLLAGTNCVRIEISASDIEDLSELRGIPSLRELIITQTPFTVRKELNIDAVSSLVNLEKLGLGMSRVRNLEPVGHLTKLVSLGVGGSLIEDLSPIEGLRSLKDVDVRDSAVVDLSPLSDASQLEQLTIDAKQAPSLDRVTQVKKLTIISQVRVDMRAVSSLSNLTVIWIWGPPIIDLSPLRTLIKLTSVTANGMMTTSLSQVRDVSALGELKQLTTLTLGSVQVDSLRFLSGSVKLTELNLSDMPITSAPELATLSSLSNLSLVDIPLVDISPLLSLTKLKKLSLLRTPARADVISALERRGVDVRNN